MLCLLKRTYQTGVSRRGEIRTCGLQTYNAAIRTSLRPNRRSFSVGSSQLNQLGSKRIIVTGGAQGIGESVVRAFAAEGAIVTSMDIDERLGSKVAVEASANGPGTASYIDLDITSKDAVVQRFCDAAEQMGGLDVMVNVAGIYEPASSAEPPQELLERITKINIWGTLNTNMAAYQIMRASGRGGAIINFGSEAGLTAEPGNAIYGMTKGAVATPGPAVLPKSGAHMVYELMLFFLMLLHACIVLLGTHSLQRIWKPTRRS